MTVAVAYLHNGTVSHSFMASLWQVRTLHTELTVWPVKSGPNSIPQSRNAAVGRLLGSELEWLWFADSDMGFHATMLDNLLAVADPIDRPIVTAPAMALVDGEPDGMGGCAQLLHPNLYEFDEGVQAFHPWPLPLPENALLRVGACGAAMLLIHRSVLELLGDRCFDRIGEMGEDLSFSRRLAEKQIPIHAHTGLKTTHYKLMLLS